MIKTLGKKDMVVVGNNFRAKLGDSAVFHVCLSYHVLITHNCLITVGGFNEFFDPILNGGLSSKKLNFSFFFLFNMQNDVNILQNNTFDY